MNIHTRHDTIKGSSRILERFENEPSVFEVAYLDEEIWDGARGLVTKPA